MLLLFCLTRWKNIRDLTRWLLIIVSHFVKSFVWYLMVFNQYSYYCGFFCLGPELRLCHRHFHMWVRCFETTKIVVLCMSSILIHMSYFSFNIIPSYHVLSSEPRAVSSYLPIVSSFWRVSSYIQVNNTTYQKLSVISRKY